MSLPFGAEGLPPELLAAILGGGGGPMGVGVPPQLGPPPFDPMLGPMPPPEFPPLLGPDLGGGMGMPPGPPPMPMGPQVPMGPPPDPMMADPMGMPMGPPDMMGGDPFAQPPPPPDPLAMFRDPAFWEQLSQMRDADDLASQEADAEKPKKKKAPKKPTESAIKDRIERVVDYWGLRDKRMDEDEDYYNLKSEVFGDGEVIVSNMPFTAVEKVANLVGSQRPTHEVFAPSNDLRSLAQNASDALTWAWRQWDDTWRESGVQGPLLRSMAFFLALRGMFAARLQYVPDEDEEGLFPVVMKMFDPRQVYPMMGDRGLRYVVLKQKFTIGQVMEEFEEAEKLFEGREDTEDVDVEGYYDAWYHAVIVDGQFVKKPEEHGYGFVPWVVTPGYGSPIRSTENDTDGWTERASYAIFHGSKDLYDQFNMIMSQIAGDIARSADPPLIFKYDPSKPDEPEKINLQPGAVNYLLYDRESVEPLQLSTRPSDVAPLLDKLQDDISRGTLPPILWGGGVGSSGFTSSILTDNAGDALFPIVEAMRWGMRRINSFTLRLIRDLHDGPVGFYVKNRGTGEWESGITISPGEIEELGLENTVEFRDIAPKDRMTMASMAQMLVKEKLISMDTARREYLGLENPERENELVLTDLIYMDDVAVKNVFVPLALQRSHPDHFLLWQIAQMRERMEKDAERAQQSGGGPPGPPGMGGPGGPPGLPPGVMPPIAQPGADPMAQSLGSVLGGMGMEAPPGMPGIGPGPGLPF